MISMPETFPDDPILLKQLLLSARKAIHKPRLLTAEPVFYSGAVGVQFHGSSAS